MAQFVDDYWDNGSLPLWITAQRQVKYDQLEYFQNINLLFILWMQKPYSSFQCFSKVLEVITQCMWIRGSLPKLL